MHMTRKEQAIAIVHHGFSVAESDPNKFAEANADPVIMKYGNAAVANLLEMLGSCGIIQDVNPIFGSAGFGFAYRLNTDVICRIQNGVPIPELIDDAIAGANNDTVASLGDLLRRCRSWSISPLYKDDLIATLAELRTCFAQDCFIACLGLSGKILEVCLKQTMITHHINFDEKWMIGQLLNTLRAAKPDFYLDRSLGEVAIIINKSRVTAVHALERVPVPTRDQAAMVIHAVIDTVNRTLQIH